MINILLVYIQPLLTSISSLLNRLNHWAGLVAIGLAFIIGWKQLKISDKQTHLSVIQSNINIIYAEVSNLNSKIISNNEAMWQCLGEEGPVAKAKLENCKEMSAFYLKQQEQNNEKLLKLMDLQMKVWKR